MTPTHADWSRLTIWLLACDKKQVTISWEELGNIVGGLPESATKHYPQWWSGDRPISRAWFRAGFERLALDPVARTLTLVRPTDHSLLEKTAPSNKDGRSLAPKFQGQENLGIVKGLESIDPRMTLFVLPCSKRKKTGGEAPLKTAESMWSPALQSARARMHDKAKVNDSAMMPAWLRYTGNFYKSAGFSLTDAIRSGAQVVILSGGYGLVHARENIGHYEEKLTPANWPADVLQDALLEEALRVSAKNVVAFAASSTGYAQIVRSTRWNRAGVEQAVLVTAHVVGGGAASKVPRDLGLAFAAFWNRQVDAYPLSISVEKLN